MSLVFNALLVVLIAAPVTQAVVKADMASGSAAKSNRSATSAMGITAEMTYSQNSLCRQNYCINPIFPGLNDLPRLEKLEWQCATNSMVKSYLDFCSGAIQYSPALPSPVSKATPVDELVKAQDDAAMTMFFYHLSGMGYDSWDYQTPKNSDNECVRTVWKMVCYTYFPRAEAGCKTGEQSMYKRPCMSSCHNYIQQCGVECCDESVSCVFAHTNHDSDGKLQLLQTGYVDALSPSATCTGSARRSVNFPFILLLGLLGLHATAGACSEGERGSRAARAGLRNPHKGGASFRCALMGICLMSAFLLQGCDIVIPKHTVGNWRTKEDYLNLFKFVPPGQPLNKAVLNSCSLDNIPPTQQCSGKGFCRSFSLSSIHAQQVKPLAFCECDRDYADPECSSKRKSQLVAFFWSLFFGYLGADYFYLGFPLWGVAKLLTLGGLGFWWLVDIIRTGAGPVYAYNYRTAADLPHWVAVLTIITVFMLIGFFVAIQSYLVYRRKKRADTAKLSLQEEERHLKRTEEDAEQLDGARYRVKGPQTFGHRAGFSGYGAALPLAHPNAAVPKAEWTGKNETYPFAGPYGPYGDGHFVANGELAPTQSDLPNFGVKHGLL